MVTGTTAVLASTDLSICSATRPGGKPRLVYALDALCRKASWRSDEAPANRVVVVMDVLTRPGHTALTPIPSAANSARRHSDSISTPALLAAYAGNVRDGVYAAADARLTMCPPSPRRTIRSPDSLQPCRSAE